MPSLTKLAAFTAQRCLRVIVESPRGSTSKFEYDPTHRVFAIGRPLPAGLAYPFDWGFVPGTRAPDGDPVDAMVLGEHVAWPGTLIEARALAMLEIREAGEGRTSTNPRILALPAWLEVEAWTTRLDALRDDLRTFFVRVGEDAGKKIVEATWRTSDEAERYVRAHRRWKAVRRRTNVR